MLRALEHMFCKTIEITGNILSRKNKDLGSYNQCPNISSSIQRKEK